MSKTTKFSRILVAVDGSQDSMKAAEYAISLAKSQNLQVDAVSVYHPSYFGLHSITDKMFNEQMDKQIKLHEGYLEEVRSRAEQQDVKVKPHLIEMTSCTMCLGHEEVSEFKPHLMEANSHIGIEITEFAKKNGNDLIVMGSKGLSGLKKMIMGSVASTVMAHATCPVMVIP